MECRYCNDGAYFKDNTYDALLEILVNKNTKSLEVHYCDSYRVIDYDQGEVTIKFCPFCGESL